MRLNIDQLQSWVKDRIFTVEFIKKNGELRTITCRLGVTKYLKGGKMNHDPKALNHLIVFDMKIKEYRTINVNTIVRIRFEGYEFNVEMEDV